MLTRIRRIHHIRIYSLLVLVLVLGVAIYFWRFHKNVSVIPSTNPVAAVTNSNNAKVSAPSQTNPKDTQSSSSKTPASTSTTSSNLVAPFGDFVANHTVSAGSNESSICNTTPGAYCYIQFTQGTTVQKLDQRVADSSGTVAWNWTVNLGSGSWTITAVASLNGQTKSTADPRVLVVQ